MRRVKQYWPAILTIATSCGFKPQQDLASDAAPQIDAIADTCTPMMTACDGRVVKTCGDDQHWNPALDRTCDFTCDRGACVGASNVPLADVATCDGTAPLLAPPPGAVVTLSSAGGTHLDCSPNCGAPGVTRIDANKKYATPAPGLSLFCLAKISLTGATQLSVASGGGPTEAIAFVVDDTVDISSIVSFDGGAAGSGSAGGHAGPGGYDGATLTSDNGHDGQGPCHGKGGTHDGPTFGDDWSGGGGGGGGNATVGGFGGNGACVDGDHHGQGGDDGGVCGNASLVPLVGGSGGGGGGDATINGPYGYAGGGGGGALQISSRTSISISGAVSARGGAGYGTMSVDGGGGGGAGGGLLFEAPMIAVTGQLIVDGGNGGISGSGPGGIGASGGSIAASGLSYSANGQGGSGGGGGGGRIRIVGGNATCTSGVSPNTSCSTSVLVSVP